MGSRTTDQLLQCLLILAFITGLFMLCNANEDKKRIKTEGNATVVKNYTLTGNPQIDYIHDPNLPRELNGYNLSAYPFYNKLPEDIDFACDDLKDGFYASVKHSCQVYHHCLFGTRYDFLCANYTAFDQRTFICQFVSDVDCPNSHLFFHRNKDLYVAKSTTPEPIKLNGKRFRPKAKAGAFYNKIKNASAAKKNLTPVKSEADAVVEEKVNEPDAQTATYDYDGDYYDYDEDVQQVARVKPRRRRPGFRRRIPARRRRIPLRRRPLYYYYDYYDDYYDDYYYDYPVAGNGKRLRGRRTKPGRRNKPGKHKDALTLAETDKAKVDQGSAKGEANTVKTIESSSDATTTTSTTTEPPPLDPVALAKKRDYIFSQSRAPPKIRPPVPLSLKTKYDMVEKRKSPSYSVSTTSTTTTPSSKYDKEAYDYYYYEDPPEPVKSDGGNKADRNLKSIIKNQRFSQDIPSASNRKAPSIVTERFQSSDGIATSSVRSTSTSLTTSRRPVRRYYSSKSAPKHDIVKPPTTTTTSTTTMRTTSTTTTTEAPEYVYEYEYVDYYEPLEDKLPSTTKHPTTERSTTTTPEPSRRRNIPHTFVRRRNITATSFARKPKPTTEAAISSPSVDYRVQQKQTFSPGVRSPAIRSRPKALQPSQPLQVSDLEGPRSATAVSRAAEEVSSTSSSSSSFSSSSSSSSSSSRRRQRPFWQRHRDSVLTKTTNLPQSSTSKSIPSSYALDNNDDTLEDYRYVDYTKWTGNRSRNRPRLTQQPEAQRENKNPSSYRFSPENDDSSSLNRNNKNPFGSNNAQYLKVVKITPAYAQQGSSTFSKISESDRSNIGFRASSPTSVTQSSSLRMEAEHKKRSWLRPQSNKKTQVGENMRFMSSITSTTNPSKPHFISLLREGESEEDFSYRDDNSELRNNRNQVGNIPFSQYHVATRGPQGVSNFNPLNHHLSFDQFRSSSTNGGPAMFGSAQENFNTFLPPPNRRSQNTGFQQFLQNFMKPFPPPYP